MRRLILLGAGVAVTLLSGCPTRPAVASEPVPAPTPAQVAERTRARLATEPLRWTARHSTQADYEVFVENQRTPHGWRRQLRTIDNGREALVIDLVEQDGVWHVLEPKHLAGAYRPFEVPLEPASHLEFLDRARLRFVDEEARQWASEEGALIARAPLPTDALTGDAPRVRERRALLERGAEWRADPTTGWLTQERFAELALVFSDFRWEEDPQLAVPRGLTATPPPPAQAPMLIARCYGTDFRLPCEADALIVDPAQPRIERRVPARGMATPVAILKDRTQLLVLRRDARGRQPVLVDLTKGTETPLGGEALAFRYATHALYDAREDRVLVALAAVAGGSPEQLALVALSRPDQLQRVIEARPGRVPHAADLLDGGTGFVLENGQLRLFGGNWHGGSGEGEEVVGLSGALLVRQQGLWYRQDRGGRRTRFGDGFRGSSPPAVSPDGTELYFVRKDGFRFIGERVLLANPKRKTRVPLPPGRYERPIWR